MVEVLLYHYTNKKGFAGIKGKHNVKQAGGSIGPDEKDLDGEPICWQPENNQPQKGTWYSDQHAAGFYLTDVNPRAMTNAIAAKMGINLRVDGANPELWLYVFAFKGEKASKKADTYIGEYKVRTDYASTGKYYITVKTEGAKMPIGSPYAYWCGPVIHYPPAF